MFVYDSRKATSRAVLVSLVLHASLMAPFLLLHGTPPQSDRLVVELYGLLSDRQVVEKDYAATPVAGSRLTEAKPPAPRQEKQEQKQQKEAPDKPEQKAQKSESPVQVAEAERRESTSQAVQQNPTAQAAPSSAPSPNAAAVKAADGNADERQKQQTFSSQDANANFVKQYLAQVKRKLQKHLVYPAEARKKGYEGYPMVQFTIMANGMIRPGSLSIAQSSGYPELDASALEAARDGEPFDRIDGGLDVAITLTFGK